MKARMAKMPKSLSRAHTPFHSHPNVATPFAQRLRNQPRKPHTCIHICRGSLKPVCAYRRASLITPNLDCAIAGQGWSCAAGAGLCSSGSVGVGRMSVLLPSDTR